MELSLYLLLSLWYFICCVFLREASLRNDFVVISINGYISQKINQVLGLWEQTSVYFRCSPRKSMHTYLHNPKSTIAIWWLLPETQAELHLFIQQTFHQHLLVTDRLSPSPWGYIAESDAVSVDIQLIRQLQQRKLGVLWQDTEVRVISWVVLEPSWR